MPGRILLSHTRVCKCVLVRPRTRSLDRSRGPDGWLLSRQHSLCALCSAPYCRHHYQWCGDNGRRLSPGALRAQGLAGLGWGGRGKAACPPAKKSGQTACTTPRAGGGWPFRCSGRAFLQATLAQWGLFPGPRTRGVFRAPCPSNLSRHYRTHHSHTLSPLFLLLFSFSGPMRARTSRRSRRPAWGQSAHPGTAPRAPPRLVLPYRRRTRRPAVSGRLPPCSARYPPTDAPSSPPPWAGSAVLRAGSRSAAPRPRPPPSPRRS